MHHCSEEPLTFANFRWYTASTYSENPSRYLNPRLHLHDTRVLYPTPTLLHGALIRSSSPICLSFANALSAIVYHAALSSFVLSPDLRSTSPTANYNQKRQPRPDRRTTTMPFFTDPVTKMEHKFAWYVVSCTLTIEELANCKQPLHSWSPIHKLFSQRPTVVLYSEEGATGLAMYAVSRPPKEPIPPHPLRMSYQGSEPRSRRKYVRTR